MPDRFVAAAAIVRDAIASGAFPAASIEVGRASGPLWRDATGRLTYEEDAPHVDVKTVFDLASLTKVLATATLTMRAVDDGRLTLDDTVARWLPQWSGGDREHVTIRDLLSHSSGLTAYLPFFRDYRGRFEFEHAICTLPLEYEPRSQSIYSDLGFMLLGFILEDAQPPAPGFRGAAGATDLSRSLATQFHRLASFFTAEPLRFNPPRAWRAITAPTEIDPWRGRLLVGEVHDENTWALGGAAGHAGLFGTAAGVGAFARVVLRTIAGDTLLANVDTMRTFITRAGVPNSSRALGWDTMLPTSSCGTLMSPTSIGHTGFTGTSLWIDWERDLYVVFLTNRVHPTRENDAIRQVRPRLHDAIVAELDGGF
ncbi:MAG TPA: serine hydrolase domain-containing protein [Vicinamibacterales bacterium]|nr:serine hydrolase domain-containing protein [Vicinamibacterales bacterium]